MTTLDPCGECHRVNGWHHLGGFSGCGTQPERTTVSRVANVTQRGEKQRALIRDAQAVFADRCSRCGHVRTRRWHSPSSFPPGIARTPVGVLPPVEGVGRCAAPADVTGFGHVGGIISCRSGVAIPRCRISRRSGPTPSPGGSTPVPVAWSAAPNSLRPALVPSRDPWSAHGMPETDTRPARIDARLNETFETPRREWTEPSRSYPRRPHSCRRDSAARAQT